MLTWCMLQIPSTASQRRSVGDLGCSETSLRELDLCDMLHPAAQRMLSFLFSVSPETVVQKPRRVSFLSDSQALTSHSDGSHKCTEWYKWHSAMLKLSLVAGVSVASFSFL